MSKRKHLSLALCTALVPALASLPAIGADSAGEPVRYAIVVTGGELLQGAYADSHTHYITRTLHPLGLSCLGSMCVDDRRDDLKAALAFAAAKAKLVIVTGGLGPTDNDITRETLADFTKVPLAENAEVLAAMARRFRTQPENLRANLRRQARTPTRGMYLENTNGTAVGLVFEYAGGVIVALPGPPRELQTMVSNELVPYLSRRFGTRRPGASLTLRFVGLGQSQISQTLKDHVPLPADVTVSSRFDGSRVDFTFMLSGNGPAQEARLQEIKAKLAKHLGENMYGEGDTSLEQHVVELLASRNQKIALVEIGSGGNLAAALSTAPDIEKVLAGAYVAPTPERLAGLLKTDEGELTSLAKAVAESTASQWVMAIGPRTADGRVEVILRDPDGRLETRTMQLRSQDKSAQARLVTQLLDRLRQCLRQTEANMPPLLRACHAG